MKYDFGDSVQLAVMDENGRSLLKPCEVVGITRVESVQQSEIFKVPIGTVLYTVEFGDGSDVSVPEGALETLAPG